MEDNIKIFLAVLTCVIIIFAVKSYFDYRQRIMISIKEKGEQSTKKVINTSEEKVNEKPKFIKSEWIGSKPGYVYYRSDEYGLGYHLDKYKKNEKGEWILIEN